MTEKHEILKCSYELEKAIMHIIYFVTPLD